MEELIFNTLQTALSGVTEINEVFIYNNNYFDSSKAMTHRYPVVGVEITTPSVVQLARYAQQHNYTVTLHLLYQSFDENHIGIYALKNKVIHACNYLSNSDPLINDGKGWGGELVLASCFGQTDFDQLNDYVMVFRTSSQIKDCPLGKDNLGNVVTEVNWRVLGDANNDGTYVQIVPSDLNEEWVSIFSGD